MYKTRIASDFFDTKGLETRTGLMTHSWDLAIIKELTDNALDAIEHNENKSIKIISHKGVLKIFDNGNGITADNVKDIYDFDNYVSKNRHIITPSRGKQGNGLKSIIGMCYIKKYILLWHTAEGNILQAEFDADQIADQELEVKFNVIGETDKKGVEIIGFKFNDDILVDNVMYQYSVCNPDVNIDLDMESINKRYKAIAESIDRTQETSLIFYGFSDFKRLISVQNPTETYKAFLNKYFGTRTANSSNIKSKIADLYFTDVETDFKSIKSTLKSKPYTLLKKHLLNFDNRFETVINAESATETNTFPCLVEYSVDKLNEKQDRTIINCYVNNSITYYDGRSINFDYGSYKISNTKTVKAYDLDSLLKSCNDYAFNIHIIAPYLKFKDYGKTEIDITDFVHILVDGLRKTIGKEKKKYSETLTKKPSKKSLAEKYMTQAFLEAGSNGKYAITARQMYYKLRELARQIDFNWETDSTYAEFTQKWLTSWIDENDQYENKVNFSERGNFYVNGSQKGLGSANVRYFIDNLESKQDKFIIYGGIQDEIHINDEEFNVKYKYDKALYIEKTGFDAVFKAEKLDEKYNLLIVSGQGFASREARRLLYNLQQQGLKLFCMHDLDISGVNIYNSMCQANDKFKFDLKMVNLGITPNDVIKYSIIPEQRVELNAFTTEQLLDIIDTKLKYECSLPSINLSESLQLDNTALREVAFMRVIKEKYESKLAKINVDYDISQYDGLYTMKEAKSVIPHIKNELMEMYMQEIRNNLTI